MPEQLILHRQLAENTWTSLRPLEGEDPAGVHIPASPVIVPVAVWQLRRDELLVRISAGEKLGVSIPSGFAIEDLEADLAHFALIAVEFPKFADGRGYSTARLLRDRYSYKGELRATGDVGRDQIFLLARVGFDSFLIPDGRNAVDALNGFNDFPDVYQGAVDQRMPLFRRRSA